MGRRAGTILAALAAGACATTSPPPPQVSAWLAAGGPPPPPQAECLAVADLDLAELARQAAERAARPTPRPAGVEDMLDPVAIPDWAERRPPADAPIVIRARMPPGGGHSSDHRVVVWREADGGWWYWRQITGVSPAPPYPPPPPEDSPYYAAWEAGRPPADRPQEFLWYPPEEGRLSARQAAIMEAAWSDPCRAWDPDWWPIEQPLNRRVDGQRVRLCPVHSSGQMAEITERGQPPRRVGASCINGTPTYSLMSTAVYAGGED